eukprot:15329424-Ditylum_brightwellii.AAC.1
MELGRMLEEFEKKISGLSDKKKFGHRCCCWRVVWCSGKVEGIHCSKYSDLHSLSHLLGQNAGIANKLDTGGYTPHHLAGAQNGHVAATSLLLSFRAADVDDRPDKNSGNDGVGSSSPNILKGCRATPLCCASFSGAVSTMHILIDWNRRGDL